MYAADPIPPAGAAIPSAPPIDSINPVPGYEGSSFNQHFVSPPAGYYEPNSIAPPLHRPEIQMPMLTEESIRDALANFVSQHCFYGKKPVQEMRILAFEPACAFHYILETFAEQRETKWAFEPYKGEFLDTPMNGPAPLPWNVPMNVTVKNFKNKTVKVKVPHTESVSQCHNCQGLGSKPCHHCLGQGKEKCNSMHSENLDCTFCRNTGWRECNSCHGRGQNRCKSCQGKGQLKCFIQLTATFKNHMDEFLGGGAPSAESLPKKLKKAEGREVFSEQGFKVFPVPNFSDQGVLSASRQVLQKHETYFATERVHSQRHKIRAIPITRVYSQFEEEQRTFYVYGLQNAVEFKDYYSKCGACCLI